MSATETSEPLSDDSTAMQYPIAVPTMLPSETSEPSSEELTAMRFPIAAPPVEVASNVRTAAPKSAPDITIKANQIPEALPPPVKPDCDTPVKKRMMKKRKNNNMARQQNPFNKRLLKQP
jgi:hypothetical protein